MPLPFLPIFVGSLVVVAFHRDSLQKKKGPGKGVLTPQRQSIYELAIKEVKDPVKLRELAKYYRDQELPAQADMLEKRASLRELPESVKAARKDAYRRAMKSQNKNEILKLAIAYERQGATGAAQSLREHASTLPDVPAEIFAVQAAPPPSPPPPVESEIEVTAQSEDVPPTEAFTEEEPTDTDTEN